jgi:hypothetical protein
MEKRLTATFFLCDYIITHLPFIAKAPFAIGSLCDLYADYLSILGRLKPEHYVFYAGQPPPCSL